MTVFDVLGFRAAGTFCGLKKNGRDDIALIVSDRPCHAAGVFTSNRVKAAPVLYDQQILANPQAAVRAVVVNTGSANACTGAAGLDHVQQTVTAAAAALGCETSQVLVLSTGVIGLPLPVEKVIGGVQALTGLINADGWDSAANAIVTTDTRPKIASVRNSEGYTITGIAKGAGMIAPNMATMLSIIGTDADISSEALNRALRIAADKSFNRIVVDGDMSTNDTVIVLANGASGVTIQDEAAFTADLEAVCVALAQAIVRDGEGATKFVTVHVTGAPDEATARTVARQIATSPLVKTAFYGADPNWGRIVCAAGYSGAAIDPAKLALWLLAEDGSTAMQLVAGGSPTDYDEPAAIQLMQESAWGVRLDLGLGSAATWVWTCDLSHDYVSINGHYRT